MICISVQILGNVRLVSGWMACTSVYWCEGKKIGRNILETSIFEKIEFQHFSTMMHNEIDWFLNYKQN